MKTALQHNPLHEAVHRATSVLEKAFDLRRYAVTYAAP